MWIDKTEGREFIQEISKNMVSLVAPEEADLFEELLQQYFDNPQAFAHSASADDDPLGSGLAEKLIVATPAAAAMASAVLSYLSSEITKATQGERVTTIKQRIHGLFNPDKTSNGLSPLTNEQTEMVKKLARKQAILFGFTADKAENMTNALIGALTLA